MSRSHIRKYTSESGQDPGIHTCKDALVTSFHKKKDNLISVVLSLLFQSSSLG